MQHLSTSFSRAFCCLLFGSVIILAIGRSPALSFSAPQSDRPHQNVHAVLSQAVLTPPLRSPEVTLRFSPNGKYLLLQDASGVALLSTAPLGILLHIASSDIYPAQFSADSQSITVVSRALAFAQWDLPAGRRIASGDLALNNGCLDGQVSPDGQFFACLSPELKFTLTEIVTQKSVLEEMLSAFAYRSSGSTLSPVNYPRVSFVYLDTESAFARPFGLIRTSSATPSPSHSLASSSIYFTPDAKALIVNSPRGALGFDLAAKKKFDVSDHFQKMKTGTIALQSVDQAVVIEEDKEKKGKSLILGLKNGKVLASPQFTAERVHLACNPRYLILNSFESGSPSAAAFDLSQIHLMDVPPNASMDVFDDTMAIYNSSGFVALYRVGERQLLSSLRLPVSALTVLSAASVTPDLEQLALSVGGAGAIFRISNGQRSSSFPKFSAANFTNQLEATLLLPGTRRDASRLVRGNFSNGETSPAWEIPKGGVLHSNGPALLEYSFKEGIPLSRFAAELPEVQVPFRLRALDPATGKELWKRDFEDSPPTPFANPQGERLVLGWRAKSSEAKDAAARNSAVNAIYKKAKLTEQDSFFEALDARSGKSLGGILVQAGSGPATFDSAFSVGEAVVLIKDDVRVSLFSLADGQLKTKLAGSVPSVSAESKLLAVDLGAGRLGIYDSNGGAKLDQQQFPDEIAYTHFSSDGKRLFVLTQHQAAVVLDVSKVREPRTTSPETD
jgi:WD40 repeat protein